MSQHEPRPPGLIRFCFILLLVFVGFWSLLASLWVWPDTLERVFLTCLLLVVGLAATICFSFMVRDTDGHP